jgi:hypothetical protein
MKKNSHTIDKTILLLVSSDKGFDLDDSALDLKITSTGAIIGVETTTMWPYGLVSLDITKAYKEKIDDADVYAIKENSGLIVNLHFVMGNVTINDKTFINDNTYGTIANVMFQSFNITFYSKQPGYIGDCPSVTEDYKLYNYAFVSAYPDSNVSGELINCMLFGFTMQGYQVQGGKVDIYLKDATKIAYVQKSEMVVDGNKIIYYYIEVVARVYPFS